MCVSDGGTAFYLMKNKYSQNFLPPVWVAASCSQLLDLWRKQTCSCRGLRAACGAGGSAPGVPAGRMAPQLPSDARGPSGISPRALCSGDPKISLSVVGKANPAVSTNAPVVSERWHSTGWARCRRCHTGESWVQMEMKSRTAKALELRRKAGMLERLGSALHGARVLAHSPACGLLWAEAWQERAAGTLSGRCGLPFPST